MTMVQRWRFARVLLMRLLVVALPEIAQAGTFPYWGLSFGTPERAAAHIGLSFGDQVPSDAEEFAMGTGPVVEATMGMGAGKIGIGRSLVILTEHRSARIIADWKVVATRSWGKPRGASAHATYLGIEGGASLSVLRFTLGVSKRIEQKSKGANVLVTWGTGIQIRLGGKKRPQP